MPELLPIDERLCGLTGPAERGFATVYAAVYRPLDATADYVWPGHRWRQTVDRFEAGTYTHAYALDAPSGARGR